MRNKKLIPFEIIEKVVDGEPEAIDEVIIMITVTWCTILYLNILVSSHITSDLEKIADYIVFIHEGKVVFEKSKDKLTDRYGVPKCGAAQFDALDKSELDSDRYRLDEEE